MFKKQLSFVVGLLAVLLIALGSCKSSFEKLKASNDNAKKYKEALRYYNEKKYGKALELFDDLVQRYRGRAEAEDLFYYYAYTNYKQRDYTSARYHFKTFADTYPSSSRAEECRFMSAYCYYLDSPIYSLDQDNTSKAIEALQYFITLYPKSDRVAEAGKLIQNLRDKLEEKSYQNAKLYLTIEDYQAAVISFNNTLRDFPDTKYAEELEFLTVKAQYLYAKNSLNLKQEERYALAITYADEYLEKHPAGKHVKDTQNYKEDSVEGIENVKRLIAQASINPKKAKELAQKDTVTSQPPSVKDKNPELVN
ncbi:MAG: outer membrane protein assembly factor BamD [Sphingobacteriaceae bacterium]|nr:MAG: outer membrane protein assembly factor BamD [Sphingobacteriaceae bacterium]